jgi:hypothetical protein
VPPSKKQNKGRKAAKRKRVQSEDDDNDGDEEEKGDEGLKIISCELPCDAKTDGLEGDENPPEGFGQGTGKEIETQVCTSSL